MKKMKIVDIVAELNLKVYAGGKGLDRMITGAYTSDLLSDVMGKAEEGDIWITMQTHKNIIAIADLKDLSGIIIVNGNVPGQDTMFKSDELNIPVLVTDDSAFRISGRLYEIMIN